MSSALRRFDPSTLVRNAPIALPQVLGLLALVTLSAAEGGYPLSDWAPAAVLIELLLVVAIVALPARNRPPWSRTAIVLITAFAVWTAASILWADDRGAAAVASTRTALLAATFVLCARWRHAPRTVAAILALLTGGLGIIAWGVLIRLHGATDLDPWFLYDRLLEPIGYVNAGAAFFGVTAFLGLGLLGSALPAPHRLIGALASVPAASLSLLCLSRGGLISAAFVVILMLAFLPGRARNGTAIVIVGVGMLVALQSLLDVGNAVRYDADAVTVLKGAIVKVFVGTAITTLITWVWIGIEGRVPSGDPVRKTASRAGAGLIALFAIVAVAAAVSEKGPVTVHKIHHAVETITRPYSEEPASESRLSAGLNSGRWDFWTVAWKQFKAAPIIGAGADNFRQDYLLEGKSFENPAYPHSIELRALGQLGVIGAFFLFGWVVFVLVAVRRLAAASDPAARAAGVAIGGAFTLWLIHGSADWLLEYGGFSAIVAAVAGLAVAASPDRRLAGVAAGGGFFADGALADGTRPAPANTDTDTDASAAADGEPASGASDAPGTEAATLEDPGQDAPRSRGPLPGGLRIPPIGSAIGVVLLLIAAVWSGAQWISDRDVESAALIGADQPTHALKRANLAASLDPFSEQSEMLLGSLAISRNNFPAAVTAYQRAYARNPRAARPRMWLGVMASSAGDQKQALRWLHAAARVAPRDGLIELLLSQAKAGTRISPRGVASQLVQITVGLTTDPNPVTATTPTTPPATTPVGTPPPPTSSTTP